MMRYSDFIIAVMKLGFAREAAVDLYDFYHEFEQDELPTIGRADRSFPSFYL